MAISSRPGRAAKLSASVAKAFGEFFMFEAMTTGDDVNARPVPDLTRTPAMIIVGVWRGPSKSATPKGRGSASDDRAHDWMTSYPSVGVEDRTMLWTTRLGDRCTRLNLSVAYTAPELAAAIAGARAAGNIFLTGAPYPDGHGRTTIPLTGRAR